jgi:ATP-dependent DNA ligase
LLQGGWRSRLPIVLSVRCPVFDLRPFWPSSSLLSYYTPDGKLIYAGRVGTGMSAAELERVWHRPRPLRVDKMPLSEPPPRGSRFGSSLVLSGVHWVRLEMIVEVGFVEWTPDGLLRHVAYQGEREDKAAIDVRRDRP